MQNITRRLLPWVAVVVLILFVSSVAMRFSDEWNWSVLDFIFAGTLLFGASLVYELVARRGDTVAYRVAVGIAVATALILVWVNGAVGIIGNEGNSANMLYFGVLVIGLIGSFITRLEPRGMAWVLFAMALAQILVPVIALMIWQPQVTSWGAAGVAGVFSLNAFFAVLFAGSGLLFRHASATGPKWKR